MRNPRPSTKNLRTTQIASALFVAAGLLFAAFPLGAFATGGGSVLAVIASPATGATFDRASGITFTDGSTDTACPITDWIWSFGDGTTSNVQNPTKAYTALGTYTVALTVKGDCVGPASENTTRISLTIVNAVPTAALAAPGSASAGDEIVFDGSASVDSDGSIASYLFTVNGVAQPAQATSTLARTFTTVGTQNVSLVVVDNNGASSPAVNTTVTIGPGALANITVTGPSTVVVGSSHTYDLAGTDAHGNAVTLSQSTLPYTAPTTPGTDEVSYTESGVTGTLPVTVVSGPLVTITVTGPSNLIVGETHEYALEGFDSYGNPVALNQSTLSYTAPSVPGAYDVEYTQDGVTGTLPVTVAAGPLARIVVSGASSMVAGTSGTYTLAGYDAYDNPVALDQTSMTFEAPTVAGPATVSYTESGVTGELVISIVADALHSVLITGPETVAAGETETFLASGFDQYGNPVNLSETSFSWTAPTTTGPATVSRTVDGVTGTLEITIVPDDVVAILVTGPDQVVAGTSASYTFRGFDQYNNEVTLQESGTTITPTVAGPIQVCYSEGEASKCRLVDVLPAALAVIVVSGPSSLRPGATGTYALAGFDEFGNAVVLEIASMAFTAPAEQGPASVSYTESGITGHKDIIVRLVESIVVSGPATMDGGSSAVFTLVGYDSDNQVVPLAQNNLTYTAPVAIGTFVVSYTELGVTGSTSVDVTRTLGSIVVSGPASVVAGTSANYTFAGYDTEGFPMALAESGVTFNAPTVVGTYAVTYEENGVVGTLPVTVVQAGLKVITVTGPAEVNSGSKYTYDLSGADQYGNPSPLAKSSIVYTAPKALGANKVCYSEQGVTGCQNVTVLLGPVAKVVVTLSRATTNVGRTVQATAVALDAGGNIVPGQNFTWSTVSTFGNISSSGLFTAHALGSAPITATTGTFSGTSFLSVQSTLNLGFAPIPAANLKVASAAAQGLEGQVTLKYLDGGNVAGASGTAVITQLVGGVAVRSMSASLVYDAGSDTYRYSIPAGWLVLGDYRVSASAALGVSSGSGTTTFSVVA